ncbi:non-ribosomal peptide synthetase, partial [Nonomuraea sp. RK-328]|nr:non-ribosomal peptide synthetase [Nonomuraea sp. RK-328]
VARAGAVAERLQGRGVTTGSRVVVSLPRSADFIVMALGVLMAGAAYVPIDPDYPASRQAFIADDCAADLIVAHCDRSSGAGVPAALLLSAPEEDAGPPSGLRVGSAADLAYVIYTSGSTGTPKGVEITHADVVNLVTADERLAVRPGEVVMHLAPTAFDASTFEIWSALTAGATVAVVTESRISTAELGAVLRDLEPDWMFLTTGLFHLLVEHDPEAVRHVGVLITGGDVLSPRYVSTAAGLVRRQLYAAYGPTEGTVFSSLHAVDPHAHHDRVPLGRPLAGKTMYVVDADGVEVPDTSPGEIWLGGAGVARGYHARPELTAQRFVEDRYHGRCYRTGDWGRVLPGDEFEFLGRLDRQLKVRGFRVEPEEIELTLQAHPQVAAAAVVLVTDDGMQRLVAYVSLRPDSEEAADGTDGAGLRSWLVQRLPAYLQPNNVVVLEELPLDPNGKLDRAALPSSWRQRSNLRSADLPPYVEPVSAIELLAAGIFQDALQIDRVGMHDSFFDLGGDSLRIAAALRQLSAAKVTVTARQFYRDPTVAGIAKLAEVGQQEAVR